MDSNATLKIFMNKKYLLIYLVLVIIFFGNFLVFKLFKFNIPGEYVIFLQIFLIFDALLFILQPIHPIIHIGLIIFYSLKPIIKIDSDKKIISIFGNVISGYKSMDLNDVEKIETKSNIIEFTLSSNEIKRIDMNMLDKKEILIKFINENV